MPNGLRAPQDDPDDLGLVRSTWDYDEEEYGPPEFTLDEDPASAAHRRAVLLAEGWPNGEMPSVGQLRTRTQRAAQCQDWHSCYEGVRGSLSPNETTTSAAHSHSICNPRILRARARS